MIFRNAKRLYVYYYSVMILLCTCIFQSVLINTNYILHTSEMNLRCYYYRFSLICDCAKYQNRHSSKNIRATQLFFCQSDSPMSESFWQKNRLVTHILFDLCLFKHFSPVANFSYQSLQFLKFRCCH